MKIYNRYPGPFEIHWSEDGKTHPEEKKNEDGKIVQRAGAPAGTLKVYRIEGNRVSPEIPVSLGQHLLKNYAKRFTADEGAIAAEVALAKKVADQKAVIDAQDEKMARIKDLVTRSADRSNKKAAAQAAEELDALLGSTSKPAALAPLPPPVDNPQDKKEPAAEPSEQEKFEA